MLFYNILWQIFIVKYYKIVVKIIWRSATETGISAPQCEKREGKDEHLVDAELTIKDQN